MLCLLGLLGSLGLLAANIWHWWIGVVLTAVSVLTVGGLVASYLKNITASRYPDRRHRDEK